MAEIDQPKQPTQTPDSLPVGEYDIADRITDIGMKLFATGVLVEALLGPVVDVKLPDSIASTHYNLPIVGDKANLTEDIGIGMLLMSASLVFTAGFLKKHKK